MATTYININGDIRDAKSINVSADRAFRGAWEFSGEAVEVNMEVAVEIQKDVLRAERAPALAELDVQFMRTLESGDNVELVSREKAVLRNVTSDPRLTAASTPDELKGLTLEALTA